MRSSTTTPRFSNARPAQSGLSVLTAPRRPGGAAPFRAGPAGDAAGTDVAMPGDGPGTGPQVSGTAGRTEQPRRGGRWDAGHLNLATRFLLKTARVLDSPPEAAIAWL